MKHEPVNRQPTTRTVPSIQARWSTAAGTGVIRLKPRQSRRALFVARLRKKVSAIARPVGRSLAAVLGLVPSRRAPGADQTRDASPVTAEILRFPRRR